MMSEEHKKKIGLANKGKLLGVKRPPRSEEWRIKISNSLKGKKHTQESIKKMSEAKKGKPSLKKGIKTNKNAWNKGLKGKEFLKYYKVAPKPPVLKGDKHPFWKGGIYPKHLALRNSKEYKLWRNAIFERDNYTCVFCGDNKGGNLNADHIKPFSLYPDLRFAIDNGRTLCVTCHRLTDTYGRRVYNYTK